MGQACLQRSIQQLQASTQLDTPLGDILAFMLAPNRYVSTVVRDPASGLKGVTDGWGPCCLPPLAATSQQCSSWSLVHAPR
jgi:hypothetical protein